MFKKTIKYVDFNGAERSEEHHFHLFLHELTRIESKLGGKTIEEHAQILAANQDYEAMVNFLENLVLTSYGIKSLDGTGLEKSPELRHKFEHSLAYAELFTELLSNAETAEAFARGISAQNKQAQQVSAVLKTVE